MDTPAAKVLSAADCLNAPDFTIGFVDVPKWGGRVFVRTMSAGDHDAWEYEQFNWDVPAAMVDPSDPEGKKLIPNPERRSNLWLKRFHARMVSLTACDENGNRLFSDNDVDALMLKDFISLKLISDKATELGQEEPVVEIEDAEKKSDDAPDSDSPTDSPLPLV